MLFGWLIDIGIKFFELLSDPDSPYGALVAGSIAGFILGNLLLFGAIIFSSAYGEGDISIGALFGISMGGGALAGGWGAAAWEQRYGRLRMMPIGQGIIGGIVGSAIGLVILIAVAL